MKKRREGGFLMAKIHQASGRIFSRILREHGVEEINPAQGRILFVLWSQDEIPISELARRTMLSKSTLTSMLDRLEKAGHIVRVRPEGDRRTILIKLTEQDRSLQRVYDEVSDKMIDIFYREFSGEEIDEFEGYLKRILANVTQNQDATMTKKRVLRKTGYEDSE